MNKVETIQLHVGSFGSSEEMQVYDEWKPCEARWIETRMNF